MTRRQFLRALVGTAARLTVCGGALAWFSAAVVRLNHQTLTIPKLPHAFDGLRIALLSDFHHSEWISREHIRSAIQLANSAKPDLIALTGDYIHRTPKWVSSCFRELAALRAPLGVFGVLGNHDHYGGATRACREAMANARIRELHNAGIELRRGHSALRIAGVADLWSGTPKLAAALDTSPSPTILLSHNPDFAERITDPRVALVLSGHTHGGQIVFPVLGAPVLPTRYGQKYRAGLCHAPHTPVFVTTGVGSSFPPVRLACPPEVALLTLRRTSA